jgi:pimeloyl-ACP methyl ester carboxylesterase
MQLSDFLTSPVPETISGIVADLAVDVTGRPDDRPPLLLLHGLTFDRRMWRPAVAQLRAVDPGRRVFAIDLPGHGESPDGAAYDLSATVSRIRDVVVEGGLVDPVLVGHSANAATVAVYASEFPTRGIIEVEGTFEVTPFAHLVRSLEPQLRGDGFLTAWDAVASRAFRLSEVSDEVRAFVQATSRPRGDVVVGSWRDLIVRSPEELNGWIAAGVAKLRAAGVAVVSVAGIEPPANEAAWLETHLPTIRMLVWAGSGHFPHLAHPRRFAKLLASTATWSAGDTASRAA